MSNMQRRNMPITSTPYEDMVSSMEKRGEKRDRLMDIHFHFFGAVTRAFLVALTAFTQLIVFAHLMIHVYA